MREKLTRRFYEDLIEAFLIDKQPNSYEAGYRKIKSHVNKLYAKLGLPNPETYGDPVCFVPTRNEPVVFSECNCYPDTVAMPKHVGYTKEIFRFFDFYQITVWVEKR